MREGRALAMMERSKVISGIKFGMNLTYDEAMSRVLRIEGNNDTMGRVLIAGVGGLVLAPFAEAGYMYAMVNPEIVTGGTVLIDRINNLINPSLPPTTPEGQIWFMWDHRDGSPH